MIILQALSHTQDRAYCRQYLFRVCLVAHPAVRRRTLFVRHDIGAHQRARSVG